MKTSQKIARNTVLQMIGKVITTVSSLIVVALITRSLGTLKYGEYATVLAYTQFFAVFADLGVNVFIIKRLSTESITHEKDLSLAYGLRIVSSILILVAAFCISFLFPYSNEVRIGIFVALFSVFAQSLNSLFVSVLQAKLEMQYAVLTDTIGRLIVLLLTLIVVLLHKDIIWVIGALTIGSVVNVLMTYIYTQRLHPFKLLFDMDGWRRILRLSIPISITSILGFIYFKVDTVMLSALPLQGGKVNTVEVGLYQSAYKVLEVLLLIPSIFLGNLFPVMSNLLANKDDRIHPLIQKTFEVLSAFGLPITAYVFLMAPKIIVFIAGESFLPAAAPLQILSFAVFISYFGGMFNYLVVAMDRQKSLIWIYAIASIFNVVANYIFIPRYSYMAAAIITLLTELIVLVLPYYLCKRVIHMRVQVRKLMQIAISVLLVSAVLWNMQTLNLAVTFVLGAALYILLIVALKIITPQEVRSLLQKGEVSTGAEII